MHRRVEIVKPHIHELEPDVVHAEYIREAPQLRKSELFESLLASSHCPQDAKRVECLKGTFMAL